MAKWRAEARARLPQLRKHIDAADSVMALWSELWFAFEQAYRAEPPDERTVSGIYSFADWCVQAPRNEDASHDPPTAVTVCFYEHLPAFGPARDDMPRWFTYEEVEQNRQVFSYLIGRQQYFELLRHMDKHRERYVPRDRGATP